VADFLLVVVAVLVLAALVFGVMALITGADPGLEPVEPDGHPIGLPTDRPLTERDFDSVRFDTGLRGYRMDQVDQALRRAAYDIGYKEELVRVYEAEVRALREGRTSDAEALLRAREAAAATGAGPEPELAETDDLLADELSEAELSEDDLAAPDESPVDLSKDDADLDLAEADLVDAERAEADEETDREPATAEPESAGGEKVSTVKG
jgi:DivIVA domain-containing protein